MAGFDALVVGAGLAGSVLAWQWRLRGRRVLLIDRGDAVTASRIAAGLITPITGKRLVVDPDFDQLFAAALAFYQAVEQAAGCQLLDRSGAVRLFQHADERRRFRRKLAHRHAGQTTPAKLAGNLLTGNLFAGNLPMGNLYSGNLVHAPLGGFIMPDAARLDVPAFLAVTRDAFMQDNAWLTADFPQQDPGIRPAILATGIAAFREGTLPAERFQPAKGEIITTHIPGFNQSRVLHRGIWLARLAPETYRVGATYSWDQLDDQPTVEGREELERRLREFLLCPFTITGHDAATRPISRTRQPIIEPLQPGLWAFNGLGSKGALLAPLHAARLIDRIEATILGQSSVGCTRPQPATVLDQTDSGQKLLQPERLPGMSFLPFLNQTDSAQKPVQAVSRPRLKTEQVHELLTHAVKPGDIVIDATAGNGHDTLHLARLVGPRGRVFAFDIQPRALKATAERLRQERFENVQLVHANHAEMAEHVAAIWHGHIAAITFNLGYLPGGDKAIITTPSETARALQSAMQLLRPGGLLTVIAYTGHPGGAAEDALVQSVLGKEPEPCDKPNAPKLYLWRK